MPAKTLQLTFCSMLKIIPRQFNICLYYAKCPICISFFATIEESRGATSAIFHDYHLCRHDQMFQKPFKSNKFLAKWNIFKNKKKLITLVITASQSYIEQIYKAKLWKKRWKYLKYLLSLIFISINLYHSWRRRQ